jgi:hypothetical protein
MIASPLEKNIMPEKKHASASISTAPIALRIRYKCEKREDFLLSDMFEI